MVPELVNFSNAAVIASLHDSAIVQASDFDFYGGKKACEQGGRACALRGCAHLGLACIVRMRQCMTNIFRFSNNIQFLWAQFARAEARSM